MNDRPIRAILGFYVAGRDTTRPRDVEDFPDHSYWHPDRETSIAEGCRVLRELRERGDKRDWVAFSFLDTVESPKDLSNVPWTQRASELH